MESVPVPSIVEYLYEHGGYKPYKCGYCKSPNTSYNQGVWGYRLNCKDFQELVDRGFQRSGKFVYKPVMKQTCCPQYVIRMNVKKFKLSKSHKSSIRKFKRFLLEGKTSAVTEVGTPGTGSSSSEEVRSPPVDSGMAVEPPSAPVADLQPESTSKETTSTTPPATAAVSQRKKEKKLVKAGLGPDPQKPPCKKAKLLRKERKEQKTQALLEKGIHTEKPTQSHSSPSSSSQGHSDADHQLFSQHLEEVLAFPETEDCVHKFRTRLVRLDSQDFTDTYLESFHVFQKFQTVIHKETEADSGEKQFNEFLVYTPLKYEEGMATGFGTYHQHYLLDDKIFAVGVLDILPKGVVCEYLYYDPDYRFITPGIMTALFEIMLSQQFYLRNPAMEYYYMGFYVQSCPKMNYKSRYGASALLCPETFSYIPLDICIPKLKASEYSRLAAADVKDASECCSDEELNRVPVLADTSLTVMPYAVYSGLHGDHAKPLLKEFIELVGLQLASNMRIYMGGRVATLAK